MSTQEKMMILEMIAQGKVTPEQGAELLRALGEPKAPAAPKPPAAPTPPAEPRVPEIGRDIGERISRDISERISRQADGLAERLTRQANEIAEAAAKQGENLGQILGEGGENLGRLLGRALSEGFSFGRGDRFQFVEEIVGEFPDDGELKINLSTRNGRIAVDTWDGDGYRLEVRKRVRASSEEEAKARAEGIFLFNCDGLSLTGKSKEAQGFFGSSSSVDLTLTLPESRAADISVSSANGRIFLDGLKGSSLKATTANGRIECTRCDFGSTEIHTANGRIEFDGKAGAVKMHTANGRITADVEGAGDWRLSTANGRIELRVRPTPGAGYDVEASSVSSKVEVSGLTDPEVLVNDTRHSLGSRRYRVRTQGYDSAEIKGAIKASAAAGKIIITF